MSVKKSISKATTENFTVSIDVSRINFEEEVSTVIAVAIKASFLKILCFLFAQTAVNDQIPRNTLVSFFGVTCFSSLLT